MRYRELLEGRKKKHHRHPRKRPVYGLYGYFGAGSNADGDSCSGDASAVSESVEDDNPA